MVLFTVRSWIDAFLAGIAAFLPAYHPILLSFSDPRLAVFTYFLYYIIAGPVSMFLGAYSATVLYSRLAAHKLILRGDASRAAYLYVSGFLIGLGISLLYYPISSIFSLRLPNMVIFSVLLIASLVLVLRSDRPAVSAVVFILSGLFGFVLLDTLNPVRFPLQAGITGIFGLGALLPALFAARDLRLRPLSDRGVPLTGVVFGVLAAVLVAYFPAVSPSIAAMLLHVFFQLDSEEVVAASGSTASASLVLSLYSREHGFIRTALAAQVPRSVPAVHLIPFALMGGVLGAAVAFATLRYLFRALSLRAFRLGSLVFALLLIYYTMGVNALFAAVAGAFLSMFSRSLGVNQNVLMGFLLVPTMLYYAFT